MYRSILGYPVGETSITRSLERRPESDGGGIGSVVRIWRTIVVFAGKVRGRRLCALIDSGSTSNYISAQCWATLELAGKLGSNFEGLTLVEVTEVHM